MNAGEPGMIGSSNMATAITQPPIASFTILLNDSYGFHIRAHHRYVLPRGYARDENISHPDYTPVFH